MREPDSWVSVNDNLPPLDQTVWLYDKNLKTAFIGVRSLVSSVGENEWLWGECHSGPYLCDGKIVSDCEFDDLNPTHWHPVPEIPKQ